MDHLEVTVTPNYLAPSEVGELLHALTNQIIWDERMKSRKTACFGQTYDDSGIAYEEVPMHALLAPLCQKLTATLGFAPTNCLINYYENGRSSMGFHSDATYNLADDTGVAIISLGAERVLTFRSKSTPNLEHAFALPSGSLLYMTQATQAHWMHAIKKTDTDDARISLTFRHILKPAELAARQTAAR
ncbi:alpha-ketoglutarate-dependent dioxygenase AlkB [Verrucomicrobium spinosum]|uniref:alpha-ketoglutarate-dependent dioxygenase AlkB n=1 Tax=Verrucomicrobium spinosum TaxID=2736 RepID=UPI00017458F4|nr:alpha-ketoglutarate-dependent dioxygenase AlkB [Verrucomicrobium spinosum]